MLHMVIVPAKPELKHCFLLPRPTSRGAFSVPLIRWKMKIFSSNKIMPSQDLEKSLTKKFNFGKINLGNK